MKPEAYRVLDFDSCGVWIIQEACFQHELGFARNASIGRLVDLPDPEGPTRTTNSLSLISAFMSVMTVFPGYRL